jgi:DNA polymerase-4
MSGARVIFHLDMDAFYASIEQRDNPPFRGKPVIVGSPPNQRGVVCAASYEARRFGVHSALPSMSAGRLCPNGIFIRPRIDYYSQESYKIMAILQATGAVLDPTSIDEAYLDFSHLLIGSSVPEDPDEPLYRAVPLARDLKRSIRHQRGLTATIGIASNKLLAKIASDFQKPDGLTLISERDKALFLRPMPVRVIPGIGKVTELALRQVGIREIGDLQDYPGDLRALVGSFGPTLRQFAFGQDDRPLDLSEEIKSISNEETFDQDTDNRQLLRRSLRTQAADIAARLRQRNLGAHTVQIKVRYGDFKTLTRQITVEEPLTEQRDIYRLSCFLLARDKLVCRPLRLLGVGVTALGEPVSKQLPLPLIQGPQGSFQ